MLKKTIKFRSKEIEFLLMEIGKEIILVIAGGDEPHIGAIAIGIPRPSLKNSSKVSSTVSTYVFTGHKDDIIANKIADEVSKKMNQKVVALVGIHFQHLSEEDIQFIVKKSEMVCQELMELLQNRK